MKALKYAAIVICIVAPPVFADQPIGDATAIIETDPVIHSGDAADDPAIWYNAADPSQSIVIGNDKKGALDVYDLSGHRIQSFVSSFYGNVDVRGNTVVAYHGGFNVFSVDPVTRVLSFVKLYKTGAGEGLCMYDSPSGKHYVFGIKRQTGTVSQVDLDTGKVVRKWVLGTEAEGCVVDDELGYIYISEEDVAIWKYGAEPTSGTTRIQIDRPTSQGGHFRPDTEGLALVTVGNGGYLISSSQAGSDSLSSFLVFDRLTGAFIREFKVVTGPLADSCGKTDGVAALATDLGPNFPYGIFICQDNTNTDPFRGYQNFKFVPLERVVSLDSGAE